VHGRTAMRIGNIESQLQELRADNRSPAESMVSGKGDGAGRAGGPNEAGRSEDIHPMRPDRGNSQHIIMDSRDCNLDPDKYRRNLDYTKHSGTGKYFVRVIDSSSGEVIREVPPEGQLDRMARIRDLIRKAYSVSDY